MAAALATLTAALGTPYPTLNTLSQHSGNCRKFSTQCIDLLSYKDLLSGRARREFLQQRNIGRKERILVKKQRQRCRALTGATISSILESGALFAVAAAGETSELVTSTFLEATGEEVEDVSVEGFKLPSFEEVQDSFSSTVNAIQSFTSDEIEQVTKPVSTFELPSFFDDAKESFEALGGSATSTLEGVVPALEEEGESVAESITVLQSKVGGALDSAQDALEDAADAAKESLSNFVDKFKLPSFEVVKGVAPQVDLAPAVESLSFEGQNEGSVGVEDAVESLFQAVDVSPGLGSEEVASDVVAAPVESVMSAVDSVLDSADALSLDDAAEALKGSVLNASKSAEAAKDAVGGAVTAATESVSETLTGALQSTTSAFSNATDSVNNAISSAVGSVVDSVKGAVSSVENTYSSVVESAQSSVSNAVGSVQSKVSGGVESVTKPIVGANRELLQGVVDSGKAAAGTAVRAAGKAAGEGYTALREALPAEYLTQLDAVERKVSLVAEPTGKVLGQAAEVFVELERKLGVDPDDPAVVVAIFLAGSTFLGVTYWQAVYGGYSGDLSPEEALELLKTDSSAVLIDVRAEELRDQEGVPDLRRGARFRTAAVEPARMQGTIRGQVKNADEVDNLITAALILGLKQVSMGSKVVVMDRDGSKSKEIARALGKLGLRRRYRMEGGFKGWQAAGMRVRDDLVVSPLEILKEETEDLVEEVKPTPVGVAAVVLGIVAGVYAIIEYERTLQLIGVVGLGTSLYVRAKSYQTADDLKKDLSLLQKPFAVGAAGLAWGLSLVEPSARPALATSSNSVEEYGGEEYGGVSSSSDEAAEEVEETAADKDVAPPVSPAPGPVAVAEAESKPQVETPSASS